MQKSLTYINTFWINIIKIHKEKDNELSPNDEGQDKFLHILRAACFPALGSTQEKLELQLG